MTFRWESRHPLSCDCAECDEYRWQVWLAAALGVTLTVVWLGVIVAVAVRVWG